MIRHNWCVASFLSTSDAHELLMWVSFSGLFARTRVITLRNLSSQKLAAWSQATSKISNKATWQCISFLQFIIIVSCTHLKLIAYIISMFVHIITSTARRNKSDISSKLVTSHPSINQTPKDRHINQFCYYVAVRCTALLHWLNCFSERVIHV